MKRAPGMRTTRLPALVVAAWMAAAGTAAAQEATACRQALMLGLDVSGSVDAREYRLQLDGLAAALEAPEVVAAFLVMPRAPVRLAVFVWSAPDHQRRIVGWTTVLRAKQLHALAARLRATRAAQIADPSTAIGAALRHGARQLAGQAGCWRRTLDISGDGPSNTGLHPGDLDAAALGGITVNGLVIGPQSRANTTKDLTNVKSLYGYYSAFVIKGPGAFVAIARDHADFRDAMRAKLLREIALPALSRAAGMRRSRRVDRADGAATPCAPPRLSAMLSHMFRVSFAGASRAVTGSQKVRCGETDVAGAARRTDTPQAEIRTGNAAAFLEPKIAMRAGLHRERGPNRAGRRVTEGPKTIHEP